MPKRIQLFVTLTVDDSVTKLSDARIAKLFSEMIDPCDGQNGIHQISMTVVAEVTEYGPAKERL